jgi:hypothetical protein
MKSLLILEVATCITHILPVMLLASCWSIWSTAAMTDLQSAHLATQSTSGRSCKPLTPEQRVEAYGDLGGFHHNVVTASPVALKLFNQGGCERCGQYWSNIDLIPTILICHVSCPMTADMLDRSCKETSTLSTLELSMFTYACVCVVKLVSWQPGPTWGAAYV